MHKRKLHVSKLRYVKDILNQARNLNRTSLVKRKKNKNKNIQPTNQQQQQTKTKGKEENNTSSVATTAATTKTNI